MAVEQELAAFVRSSFRSVWALELLLHLKRGGDRYWTRTELVETLRASDLVVASGIESLLAAGLVLQRDDGSARFAPASPDLARLVDGAEALYAKKPDAVRRMIVAAASDGAAAFAAAFKLRRD
jgi:hypothetical protein